MKTLIAFVLLSISICSFAQSNLDSFSDNGRAFKQIKTASGVELKNKLNSLYEKNSLDRTKRYLLVNVNQHPGLICHTVVNFKQEGVPDIEINGNENNGETVLIAMPEGDQSASVITACGSITFISNAECESSMDDAINRSISSLVISSHELVSRPEDSEKSRILKGENQKGSIYKVEILK